MPRATPHSHWKWIQVDSIVVLGAGGFVCFVLFCFLPLSEHLALRKENKTEHPRGKMVLASQLTLQYSSIGIRRLTATSRMWLRRKRILPAGDENTLSTGGTSGPPPTTCSICLRGDLSGTKVPGCPQYFQAVPGYMGSHAQAKLLKAPLL